MRKAKTIWTMWAHREKDRNGADKPMYLHASEDKGWVKMHELDIPVVRVEVRENLRGEYFGWIDAGKTVPEMIWMGKNLFDCCFTYGPEEEEKRGKGRIVRLDVKEVSRTKTT